ncbi:MAG: hypothetical protein BWX88_03761 [Planctomycetes bacterium ADurb.Bin126]|nr:MAG: hypothetical protein BWX88_03761 [Planctomycetes bacterium ADurb.Bin126]
MADLQPPAHPHDGVEIHIGRHRQQDELEQVHQPGPSVGYARPVEVSGPRDLRVPQDRAVGRLGQVRQEVQQQQRQRPRTGQRARQQPASDQRRQPSPGDQAPAQVVEDHPPAVGRQRVARGGILRGRHVAGGPPRNLPVAPHPAVPPGQVRRHRRRVVLQQFHVVDEPATGVAALDQVMAQDAVVRKTPVQRGRERLHVVHALARELGLANYIVVHVGHLARVRVQPHLARHQPRVPRLLGRQQAHRQPRLENAVPLSHAGGPLVQLRTVDRVRDAAHHFPHRLRRQLRVAVQGDHVPHPPQRRHVAYHRGKWGRYPISARWRRVLRSFFGR